MIHQVYLTDFKAHRSTQLPMGRFTVLVGDNASGKTSVLDALAIIGGLGTNPVPILRDNYAPHDLLRHGAGADDAIKLAAEGTTRNNIAWRTVLEIRPNSRESDKGWELALAGQLGTHAFKGSASGQGGGGSASGGWEHVVTTVGTAGLYRMRADRIGAAAYSGLPEKTQVETDGTNTAVVLAEMKLGNDEAFQRIEDAIRKLIPSIERVRIQPALVQHPSPQLGSVKGHRLYFDFRGGVTGVPAHHASHGTLIVLALLAVLHSPNRPNLILLDDFDHALHPRAQMELVRMIKDLLKLDAFSDLQVVATTHSPYVLDELDTSEVHAFAIREDGTVASRRLSEHPEAAKMTGTLRAGQLWSLDPERDWVLRG